MDGWRQTYDKCVGGQMATSKILIQEDGRHWKEGLIREIFTPLMLISSWPFPLVVDVEINWYGTMQTMVASVLDRLIIWRMLWSKMRLRKVAARISRRIGHLFGIHTSNTEYRAGKPARICYPRQRTWQREGSQLISLVHVLEKLLKTFTMHC
ncbi:hypothetical protein Salat_2507800 [Sesamum alatum]|uniref:Uncharacterized protein n=1 Tax=Sesamum alatum TaxID=300844 RepID=A0AAE2CC70_9LAMI|nr:hypothetical protein Salat_2507800 [Sesamum alatum]